MEHRLNVCVFHDPRRRKENEIGSGGGKNARFRERIHAFGKEYFCTQPVNPGAVLNPSMRRRETGKVGEQGLCQLWRQKFTAVIKRRETFIPSPRDSKSARKWRARGQRRKSTMRILQVRWTPYVSNYWTLLNIKQVTWFGKCEGWKTVKDDNEEPFEKNGIKEY